jgi:peptide/nickel transport system substrate-binding protein
MSSTEGILQAPISRRQFMAYTGKAGVAAMLASPIVAAACGGETASGVMRFGHLNIFDTANPVVTVSTPDMHWLVYDRLMEFDDNLSPQLSLATSRVLSNGGATVTYTIRAGVEFHDGEALTSADIKYSFELYRDTKKSLFGGFFEPLQTVEAPDDLTVVLNFSGPPSLDPSVGAPILPAHIWRGMSSEDIDLFGNDEMIGSGAFKLNSYVPDTRLELDRNSDWWGWASNDGPKPGTLEGIVKVQLANEETLANSLRANEIDVTGAISSPDIWKGLQGEPNIVAEEYPALVLDHFGINVYEDPDNPGQPHPDSGGNPLLLDPVIREAMSWAMDRQRLVDLVLAGRGLKGSVVLPPGLGDSFLEIPEGEQANGNPDRARQILEEAGYTDRDGDGVRESPDGQKLSFRLFASTVIDRLPLYAELIKPMLEDIGMEIQGVFGEDDPTLIQRVFVDADWDMYTWVWQTPPDATFMLSVQSCDQFGNLSDTYYCDADYEALFKAQQTQGDPATRLAMVKEAQQIFYDSFAYCVMAYPTKLQAYRSDNLTGWPYVNNGITTNWSTETFLVVSEA